MAFIHLDGNDLSAQETINTGYTGGAQTAWLGNALASYRSPGSGIAQALAVDAGSGVEAPPPKRAA